MAVRLVVAGSHYCCCGCCILLVDPSVSKICTCCLVESSTTAIRCETFLARVSRRPGAPPAAEQQWSRVLGRTVPASAEGTAVDRQQLHNAAASVQTDE